MCTKIVLFSTVHTILGCIDNLISLMEAIYFLLLLLFQHKIGYRQREKCFGISRFQFCHYIVWKLYFFFSVDTHTQQQQQKQHTNGHIFNAPCFFFFFKQSLLKLWFFFKFTAEQQFTINFRCKYFIERKRKKEHTLKQWILYKLLGFFFSAMLFEIGRLLFVIYPSKYLTHLISIPMSLYLQVAESLEPQYWKQFQKLK